MNTQNILNAIGGKVRTISFKLIQLSPLMIIVFITYGDRFLPSPLNQWSLSSRNSFNQILLSSFSEDGIKNKSYNNKKSDRLIEEMENQGR